MTESLLDQAARQVLAQYPGFHASETVLPVGNAGGFSGARLWRLRADGPLCLRAWPPGSTSPERLRWLHGLLDTAREAGLSFVPAVLRTSRGTTWIEHSGRLWELTSWMSGRADFHAHPTSARLSSACSALAQLHAVWSGIDASTGPCPGVQRRLQAARTRCELRRNGWQPPIPRASSDELHRWARRAWDLLDAHADFIPHALAGWAERPLLLHPCLCDVWHDHVLFEGDTVTGLVDYGSVKVDHVAVDLARLLGSLVADNRAAWAAGLDAYARLRPLSPAEQSLARILDETGTLVGLMNWLLWLYRDGRIFDDPAAVARRLAELVERVEGWESRR
jgi:homoserine kinase type II